MTLLNPKFQFKICSGINIAELINTLKSPIHLNPGWQFSLKSQNFRIYEMFIYIGRISYPTTIFEFHFHLK